MNQTFVYIQYIHVLGCGTCPWTEILRLFNIFFDFVIACLHSFFAVLSPSNSLFFINVGKYFWTVIDWFPARLPQCRKHNENSCVEKKHKETETNNPHPKLHTARKVNKDFTSYDGSLTHKVSADMSEVLGTVVGETLSSLIFMDTSMILRAIAGPMLRHIFECHLSPHRRSPHYT